MQKLMQVVFVVTVALILAVLIMQYAMSRPVILV
jgi:hypothetical protein